MGANPVPFQCRHRRPDRTCNIGAPEYRLASHQLPLLGEEHPGSAGDAARCIHRNEMMIYTQVINLDVAVGEQAPLQHFVGREADAGRDAGGIESRLLHFREKVFRIAVEFHHPRIDQRAVFMQPDLGEIERVVG